MRKITIERNLYNFNELCEDAKKRVKNWYLESQEPEIFTEMIMDDLKMLFPHSSLDIQYSLASCQGDGLNIYGNINFYDILDYLKNSFSETEQEILKEYFSYDDCFELEQNRRYYYCIIDNQDMLESLIEELDDCDIEYNEKLIKKFEQAAKLCLIDLCKKYEDNGYKYFYEISESDLQEFCDSMGYEFLEDGTVF